MPDQITSQTKDPVEDAGVPLSFQLLTVFVVLLACGVFAWVAYAMNLLTYLTGTLP